MSKKFTLPKVFMESSSSSEEEPEETGIKLVDFDYTKHLPGANPLIPKSEIPEWPRCGSRLAIFPIMRFKGFERDEPFAEFNPDYDPNSF